MTSFVKELPLHILKEEARRKGNVLYAFFKAKGLDRDPDGCELFVDKTVLHAGFLDGRKRRDREQILDSAQSIEARGMRLKK